ncbi:O-antigen polysaccharide polymerase Wzy [Fibrobacter sp. UWB1]|uniref:O-antigen polysaccharide polymerase Wzy n=1 Tax=Fibrobacter sp. UWB1 TaxID=1964355 RepID=UPI002016097D|nr:O-antigen polysaccharide polymerase Wzy [Fibrobacter sp. UWB1]
MQMTSKIFLLLALINSAIVINEIFSYAEKPFSLHKIVNFFILFFFILANAIQYSSQSIVTSLIVTFDDGDYVFFQIIIFLIIGVFNILYHYFIKRNFGLQLQLIDNEKVNYYKLLAISSFAVVLTLWYYKNRMGMLFFRGFAENLYIVKTDGSMNLLVDKFIRSIPFACCAFALLKKIPKKYSFILFLQMLVTVFPLGLSRNAIAMYWLPIMLLLMTFMRKRYVFVLILFVFLLVVFPFLGNFRYFNGSISFDSVNLEYLNSMNYDASQEFMALLKLDVITYGRQLLGVALFFLPRSFWPSKPIGSGAFLAEGQHVFGNISMPLFGEGYINFGYVGILLFVILTAAFCAIMDNTFWNKKNLFISFSWNIEYLVLLGAFLFILRGDLLSSFAYTVGVLAACLFTKKLCVKNYSHKST